MPTSASSRLQGELRGWIGLAVGALALAGFLAALLAASRTPGVSEHLPLAYFRIALVTHVVFSFVVWYLVMLGAYCTWVLDRLSKDTDGRRAEYLGRWGLYGVATSLVLMLIPALFGWGAPSLNDYIPMVDHPLFQAGLVLLLGAVALPVIRLFANLSYRADGVAWAIAAAGFAYLIALCCFAIGWVIAPFGTSSTEDTYQTLFWGGGHVLQFVHTALILVIWWELATHLHGRPPASPKILAALCLSIAAASLAAPLFYGLWDSNDPALAHAYTLLYKLGLIVQPTLGMAVVAWAFFRRGSALSTLGGSAVVLSWVLFAVGGLMGYSLTSSDTRTPAHYHAMIGAVTLAHMAMLCVILLPALNRPLGQGRWAGRWARAMIWFYALGQLTHSGGLFLAGTYGIARKTAGNAQGLEGIAQKGAMLIMGLGGGIAVIGGVIFVIFSLRSVLRRSKTYSPPILDL